jgi:hypothetical protein
MFDARPPACIGQTGDPFEGKDGGPPKGPTASCRNPARDHHCQTSREENPMKIVRRLLISVGAIAAFMMAAGAGWKN